jgi:YYY domain-containing protein
MMEMEHLLFACTWLILYLILQLCTWLILRIWLSSPLALPASFAVSLLCSCLISWYLAWLGFSPVYTLMVFLMLTGIVFGTIEKARIGILSDLKEGKWYYALFFLVFFIMILIRMLQPGIYYLPFEKPSNLALISSIMRAPLVPPLDPWLAGGTSEVYYYLGHWCFAILGLIAHIPSWVVFQLILPTVASVSAVQLYGIGKLILRRFSLLPVILLFITNLEFVRQYILGADFFSLLPRSASAIAGTYTDYPLYSFLFGDVHAHTMTTFNLSFFLLMIVYLFTQWQKLINSERALCAILAGISLGTMFGMNVWNVFAYGPIFALAAIIIWYQTHRGAEGGEESSGAQTWVLKTCTHLYHDISDVVKKRVGLSHSAAAVWYLWILVPLFTFLSYAPFFLMMRPYGAHGIGFVSTKTALPEFFFTFGFFLFLFVCTLYSDIKKHPELLAIALPFFIAGYSMIGLILVLLAYLIARHENVSDFLFGCGLVLVLLCEFIYIIDSTNARSNTMWKIYYTAWLLLGVGALCSASIRFEQFMDQVCHTEKGAIIEKYLPKLAVGGVVLLILSVPLLTNDLKYLSYNSIQGLEGFTWMKHSNPGDYAAAMYLRELPGEYVLVATPGDLNLYSTRITYLTGIPTILGVSSHVLGWRGYDPPGWIEERMVDVSIIYEQPERSSEIMAKYNADFLILGAPERLAYLIPDDFEAYLSDLVPIFTANETTIYQRVEKIEEL